VSARRDDKEEVRSEEGRPTASDEAAADTPGGSADSDLAGQLAEARRQLQESNERLLRLAADFDNTRKRLERERETALKYAEESLLRELLPGIDNLERAMAQGQETDNASVLLEGVELTWRGLLATLEKTGVAQIHCVGEPFDPNRHEALSMEASATMPANHVLKEFQKGYFYKDRLLRAAKVIVCSGLPAKG